MTLTVHTRRLVLGGALLAAGGLGLAAALSVAQAPAAKEKAAAQPIPFGKPGEHPMFGGSPDRNMVNLTGKFAPAVLAKLDDEGKLTPAEGVSIKWQGELGSRAYGGPVVAGGKVYVGTNNERPRNPRDTLKNADGEVEPIDKGVLMCFDEATGKLLWQAVHDKLPGGLVVDWPKEGVCSTPVVEGNRIYYVSNQCRVVCLDVNGLADGNQGPITNEPNADPTDADFVWELDMLGSLGVFPHNMAACSPLLVGDVLFVVTANGVDEGHINIPAPDAPSFLAIDKNSGKVLWKRNDPGRQIMHGQWSNPTYGVFNGVGQVIFPGGDGWLRGLKPETGELLWQFDCNPKKSRYELGGTGTKNDFIGTPVVYDNKIYIGVGQDPEHFSGIGHFWCIDPTKATKPGQDISPKNDNFDPKAPENKDSGLVWHYGGEDRRKFVPRDFVFGRTMSTASIVDDVVYIAELQGFVHCLDAKTGKKYWQHDLKGAIWGSTYYVDGKVYLATEGGDLFCYKHEKQPKVMDDLDIPDAKDVRDYNKLRRAKRTEVEKAYLLGKSEFDAAIRSTPVVVNGVMYVMTEKALYALEAKK
jgi:outer membrane protein assembly factor BamB